jgi:hypothetical protein
LSYRQSTLKHGFICKNIVGETDVPTTTKEDPNKTVPLLANLAPSIHRKHYWHWYGDCPNDFSF